MSQSIGKHILIDCYGCRLSRINNFEGINEAIAQTVQFLGLDVFDTKVHQTDDGLTIIAVGINSHICIHSYPQFQYLAADVFTFHTHPDPASAMQIFRRQFRPDKIRATSIKRGKVETTRDMKPKTTSKTTQWRRVKSTGQQIKRTGGQVLKGFRPHKNDSLSVSSREEKKQ